MFVNVPEDYHLEHSLCEMRMGRYDPTLELSETRARIARPTPEGAGTLVLDRDARAGGVHVQGLGPGAAWLVENGRVEALLGLGDDPSRFQPKQTVVRRLSQRFAGMYLPRVPVLFSRLVQVVLLQLVTSREAVSSWRRLVTALGETAPDTDGLLVPPGAEAILRTPEYELVSLGIRPRQARTLRTVARYAGRIESAGRQSPEALAGLLEALRGVGPWTVQYVLGSALGCADAVVLGDYNLPSTVAFVLAGEPRADDARMLELLEPYRGHRFRVIRLIWMNGRHAPRRGPRL